jgi:hypothetical protein
MAYTTIDKSSDHFNVVTWTGTSDATTAVTGVGHQPDFIWIKNRGVADDHMVYDAVRGGTKRIFPNSVVAEGTESQGIQSFDSDGFTTGTHRATGGDSGNTMVSWNWKGANGTASNSNGSITSTVSANTTSGFSIVSYTGTEANATVGHGLSSAPELIIFKNRVRNDGDWIVGADPIHSSWEKFLYLSGNNAETDLALFQDTAPTSSVFYLGSDGNINDSAAGGIIAYCFHSVKGFSKIGTYTGNNNTDGNFVYTGFQPAWVMIKDRSSTQYWHIADNQRDTFNPRIGDLTASESWTESTTTSNRGSTPIDFLSNGFKIRSDTSGINGTGNHIYMAFAEHPFVTSTGTPCTAR